MYVYDHLNIPRETILLIKEEKIRRRLSIYSLYLNLLGILFSTIGKKLL